MLTVVVVGPYLNMVQYSVKTSLFFAVSGFTLSKFLSGPAGFSALFQLLDENDQLIRCITEYMQKGRAVECVQ